MKPQLELIAPQPGDGAAVVAVPPVGEERPGEQRGQKVENRDKQGRQRDGGGHFGVEIPLEDVDEQRGGDDEEGEVGKLPRRLDRNDPLFPDEDADRHEQEHDPHLPGQLLRDHWRPSVSAQSSESSAHSSISAASAARFSSICAQSPLTRW